MTFDRAWALERLGDDSALLAELARLFLEENSALLPALREAMERRDWKAVETNAHTLKGSAANFGAREVCEDALALEQSGLRGNSDEIRERLVIFERSMARFTDELKAMVIST